MSGCGCGHAVEHWRHVENPGARDLAASIVGMARAHVAYSRELTASKRAVALLGEGAGRERELRAEVHHAARLGSARAAQSALPRLKRGVDAKERSRIGDFLGKGGLRDLTASARRLAIVGLVDSEETPDAAAEGLKALDDAIADVEGVGSLDAALRYLDRRLGEFIAKPMGNQGAEYGLCVLILILASVLVILVLLAAIICALSGGSCEGTLEQLLLDACT
jgi:hypothetical protein